MVTLQFSSNTTSLASVILAMDRMYKEVTIASQSTDYLPMLQVALTLRINFLNKYYSLTDDLEVYHIAMGMLWPGCQN
jgi:hypothetical protein